MRFYTEFQILETKFSYHNTHDWNADSSCCNFDALDVKGSVLKEYLKIRGQIGYSIENFQDFQEFKNKNAIDKSNVISFSDIVTVTYEENEEYC